MACQQIVFDRRPVVESTLGKKRSALYEDISCGLMTPAVPIGRRAVAWPRHETQAVAEARLAGKSEQEIRDLVKSLVAARKAA
jgi:prophage regulatory protein